MDVCTCCDIPVSDSLIDYVFMRKMYELHKDKGVEGITPICIKCSPDCEEYENVKI